jgi:CheY-specific phosphatase CheX
MSTEHINSFLQPAQLVWARALRAELRLWKTGFEVIDKTPADLTAVVEVVGALQGTVLYSLDRPAMRAAVRTMIENRTLSPDISFSHMSQDAVVEAAFLQLAKMITDEAVQMLRKSGAACMVASASLVKPMGTPLGPASGPHTVVAFRSAVGSLKVRIHQDLLAKAAKAA